MSEVTYKVQLLGNDGKNYVITYDALAERLQPYFPPWNNVTNYLEKELRNLSSLVVREILVPKMRATIVSYLKKNPNVSTGLFYVEAYKLDSLERVAWFEAKEMLETEGLVVSIKQGRGRNRLWKLEKENP